MGHSRASIRQAASRVLKSVWAAREKYGITRETVGLVTDPQLGIDVIGYRLSVVHNLTYAGYSGGAIAGYVNRQKRLIYLCDRFPAHVMRFTAAHELGHAVLHSNLIDHRDLPLDGAAVPGPHKPHEREADIFAAEYLMPEEYFTKQFSLRFGPKPVAIDEVLESHLHLPTGSAASMSRGEVCGFLAGFYGRDGLPSLAHTFRLSTQAVAIRIDQLGLILY